jgi:hypothetical protein
VEPFNLDALFDRVMSLLNSPRSLIPEFADFQLSDMQRQEIELYEELAGMRQAARIRHAA